VTADRGTPDAAAETADGGDPGTPDAAAATPDSRAAGLSGDTATRDDAAGRSPRFVFCGGCNPHIDRGAVAAELTAVSAGAAMTGAGAAGAAETGADDAAADAGPTVYLSGCPRACASDHRLTGDEPRDVVVAGEVVDGRPTPRQDIAAAVRQKLKE
jgi:hypothetical protein